MKTRGCENSTMKTHKFKHQIRHFLDMQWTRGMYLDLGLNRLLPSNIDLAKHNG